jgi:hypothetical protein
MSQTSISKDMESTASPARGRQGWRARVSVGCAVLAAAVVTVASVAGVASAATVPTARLSFSPARISADTQPDMKFASQDVPSGSVLYLQESSDGGRQWTTVAKTTHTQGTANIAALSQGVYKFRIIIADNGIEHAVSALATLTVTAPGAAPAPAPTATAAPSGSGIPWLTIIVKPIWDAIVTAVIGWIIALF